MEHDALGVHYRDEIGVSELSQGQPIVAAVSSALSFSIGAALPLLTALFYLAANATLLVAMHSLFFCR